MIVIRGMNLHRNLSGKMTSLKTRSGEPLKSAVVTVNAIPPEIVQYFDHKLLSIPIGMREPEYYSRYYEDWARAKYKPGSRKMREFEEILEIYGHIYEWKKAQEAYIKTEKKEATQRPIVPTEAIYRLRGGLGKTFRDAFTSATLIQGATLWKKH